MHRPALALAAIAFTFAVLGCKKDPEEGSAAAGGDDRARVQKLCEGMSDLSLAYVAGVLELGIDSLDQPGARAKVMAACKELSLDVAECADRLALDDPKCNKALEKQMGLTDATPKGAGPSPAWELSAPFEIYDLDVSPEGHVAIAGEKGVGAVIDGALKWSVELADGGARVAWWKECLLAGVDGELRCYDAAGGVTWSTFVTKEADAWLSAIEVDPERGPVVVTSDGAVVRIDGDACAKQAAGCTTTHATIETLGGGSIELLPGGAILGTNDAGVTLVSATGATLAVRAAELAASIPRGGLVVVKREVLRANPACKAIDADGDEPKGADDCFAVVASDPDLEIVAPLEIEGVGIAYADSYGVIEMVGPTKWQVDAGNDGDLVGDGTTIYSVGHQLGLGSALEAPPQLRAIDARTGETRWITKLGTERAGLLSGYIVALNGGHVIVAMKSQLFAVPVESG